MLHHFNDFVSKLLAVCIVENVSVISYFLLLIFTAIQINSSEREDSHPCLPSSLQVLLIVIELVKGCGVETDLLLYAFEHLIVFLTNDILQVNELLSPLHIPSPYIIFQPESIALHSSTHQTSIVAGYLPVILHTHQLPVISIVH